jgi:hypothetical protein
MRGAYAVYDAYRLFMVPGILHCGGDGPNTFDAIRVLEESVEQRKALDRMVAFRRLGRIVDRTASLLPYPQVASTKDRESVDGVAGVRGPMGPTTIPSALP